MITQYVDAVSTYAHDVDNLIYLIGGLTGFWFFACEIMFFWLLAKYKKQDGRRADYLEGHEKHVHKWIQIPHALVLVCDIFILIAAIRVWYNVKQVLPKPESTIRVIGQQWVWTFVHPGADNKLDTADDIVTVDNLHVAVDTVYNYELQSKDVLHDFSVPVFRLKQDAIPGRTVKGWFKAMKTGEWDFQCAEMCGIGHGIMSARIHIESKADHAKWIATHSVPSPHVSIGALSAAK